MRNDRLCLAVNKAHLASASVTRDMKASVMKGCRSGVQKLIRNEIPHLYDEGCINHLADLTIKAGVTTLPIDIDQLFIARYLLLLLQ